MNYTLIPCRPDDASFLAELFSDVRAPEFAPLGLPPLALDQLLNMQFQAQTNGYAAQFPLAQDHMIWIGSERAGRFLVNRSATEIQLVDIALLSRFRNQGIGASLLGQLCDEATRTGLPLRLMVRFGNPAEHLYQRSGFSHTGSDGINISMEFRAGQSPILHDGPKSLPVDEGPVEPGLTLRYFRTLRGQTLDARAANGAHAALVLELAQPLRPPLRGGPANLGDSFRLEFSGPLTPILPPDETFITAPGEETIGIFLSPFATENGVVKYEAIFNRMTPA
jgi:GNAT superfamily N-acetyltransferase